MKPVFLIKHKSNLYISMLTFFLSLTVKYKGILITRTLILELLNLLNIFINLCYINFLSKKHMSIS